MGRSLISVGGIGLALASVCHAQAAPICADRPGKATATCTVPRARVQVETGLADWSLQKIGGERDASLVIGETTVKYGLTGNSDIEVDVTPWQRASRSNPGLHDRAGGVGDVNLIYKRQLTSAASPVQVAARPYIKVPLAKRALGNGKSEGGVLVPIATPIPGSPLTLAFTPEIDWTADSDGRGHHAAMAQVASLTWQASGKLNLSAELWGSWDWDPTGTTRQRSADAAVAYLVRDDLQLDAGANLGFSRETPDVELYGGVSVRF